MLAPMRRGGKLKSRRHLVLVKTVSCWLGKTRLILQGQQLKLTASLNFICARKQSMSDWELCRLALSPEWDSTVLLHCVGKRCRLGSSSRSGALRIGAPYPNCGAFV